MDSYFVDLTAMDGENYPVYFGPKEGSAHNELVALFVSEQEAWNYCNYRNSLEESDFDEDDADYEDLDYEAD